MTVLSCHTRGTVLSFSNDRSQSSCVPPRRHDYVRRACAEHGRGIVDAIFVMLAMQIVSAETVIPLLLTRLGASTIVLGAVMAMNSVVSFLPQLFAAGLIRERTFKKPVSVVCSGMDRLCYLAVGVSVLLWGASAPHLALAAFIFIRTLRLGARFQCRPAYAGR